MKIVAKREEGPHLPIDLTLVPDTSLVAVFGAAINTGHVRTGGEMTVTLIVPYAQIPNVMPVMQYVGGVVFKVTVERVPRDELPESGWQ